MKLREKKEKGKKRESQIKEGDNRAWQAYILRSGTTDCEMRKLMAFRASAGCWSFLKTAKMGKKVALESLIPFSFIFRVTSQGRRR